MGGPATGEQEYLGIATALLRLGHTMYDPATIDAELAIQLANDLGKPNARRLLGLCYQRAAIPQLPDNVGGTIAHHNGSHPWHVLLNQVVHGRISGESHGLRLGPTCNQRAGPGVPTNFKIMEVAYRKHHHRLG
jgi:hypothetical protein